MEPLSARADAEEDNNVPNDQVVLGQSINLFGSATLHIVSEVTAGAWRLLFAKVELLPVEIPAPVREKPIPGPQVNKKQTRVFSHHISTNVQTALVWYEQARLGTAMPRPEPDGQLLAKNSAKACFTANNWLTEPDWPNWITVGPELPFLSRWQAGATRVHHLLARDFEWSYPPKDSILLDDFLEREVGFRRTEWPHWAGSVHLLVPSPYIRELVESLHTPATPEGGKVAVVPRQGVEPPPMQIEIDEHRPTGIGCSHVVDSLSSEQRLPMYREVSQVSTTVRNITTGQIEAHTPALPFMRQVGLTLDISSHRRKVSIYDLAGVLLEEEEVVVAQPGTASLTGEGTGEALALLERMSAERRIRASAANLEQFWVSGNPEAARLYVRERVGNAREQVMIIDPYLGWVDIQRYAFFTRLSGVPVRLLSSGLAFKKTEAGPATSPVALERELRSALKRDSTLGDIQVRIMSVSELHDRFLRVDSRLYALGNSLNSLGDRAGLMMRIPDPKPVFEQLEGIWDRAQPLAQNAQDWLKRNPGSGQ